MKRLAGTLLGAVLLAGFGAYLWAQDSAVANQPAQSPYAAPYSYGCWDDVNPSGGSMGMRHGGRMGGGMMGPGMMGPGMMGSGRMWGGRMGRGGMGWAAPGRGMVHGRMWMSPNLQSEGMYRTCPWHAREFDLWAQENQVSVPLTQENAKKWAEYYLSTYRNPDLKLGKIRDRGDAFEVEIRSEKENKILEKILIDKQTGWVSPVQP